MNEMRDKIVSEIVSNKRFVGKNIVMPEYYPPDSMGISREKNIPPEEWVFDSQIVHATRV